MKAENIVKGTVTAVSSFFASILGMLAVRKRRITGYELE